MLPFIALFALQQVQQPPAPAPYWQQRVVYQINARLDEPTFTLRGDQRVMYVNHSPDVLHTISFHLYLNAFRPGSRWSDADSAEGKRRFNDLKDPGYGSNHISNVKIGGVAVQALWPLAPDSTIVRFMLPKEIAPGDSTEITMDWDARPSIVPRRQGRRGRSYDFAQWYPKVVVYDKFGWEEHALYPAGEFYGEFGDFYVKLDVPSDQVVGATGVPVCGDPGWKAANRGADSIRIGNSFGPPPQRFTDAATLPDRCVLMSAPRRMDAMREVVAGRKEMIWVARDVHNFAISMSPDYRYEGGEWNGIQVHVLYQPGDDTTWGRGKVVANTITTLKWLDAIFGKYPWPQMTVVHRIEGGGTEFPMMQMNGSASLGLNLHEGGHSYLMGILANNEWKEGWLDEGFTSFQTSWYQELQAKNDGAVRNLEANILLSDLDNGSEPVSTPSEQFRDFNTYNNMIYSRGELFLHELKRAVGDEAMLQILRTYYDRWKLHHVDEAAFKAVAEEVSGRDLTTFFAQWLHSVVLTDYAIHSAKREKTATGWRTTVDIERKSPGIFPVTVMVYAGSELTSVDLRGAGERQQVTLMTQAKPTRVVLDPAVESHDWNMLNNQWRFGGLFGHQGQSTEPYLDTWFSQRISRTRLTVGIMPTLWYNDVGGATIGIHHRSDYLGRFEQNDLSLFCGVRDTVTGAGKFGSCGFSASIGNPIGGYKPNTSERISAFREEGRAGASIAVEMVHADHEGFGPTKTTGGSVSWLATYDMSYLPRTLWDDGGSVEGALWWGISDRAGRWQLSANGRLAGGMMYRSPGGGFTTTKRYDAQLYARPEITITARRPVLKRSTFAARVYAAGVFSNDPVLSQRRIFIAGADPTQTISNPFVRSVGAPLLWDNCLCRWQTPGDGNLRGFHQSFSTDRLLALNVELETTVMRSGNPLLSKMALTVFGDGAYTGRNSSIGGVGDSSYLPTPSRWLGDAGIGLRLFHKIGTTTWTSRIDVPFLVSDAQWAFAHRLSNVGFNRLILSLSPVIR